MSIRACFAIVSRRSHALHRNSSRFISQNSRRSVSSKVVRVIPVRCDSDKIPLTENKKYVSGTKKRLLPTELEVTEALIAGGWVLPHGVNVNGFIDCIQQSLGYYPWFAARINHDPSSNIFSLLHNNAGIDLEIAVLNTPLSLSNDKDRQQIENSVDPNNRAATYFNLNRSPTNINRGDVPILSIRLTYLNRTEAEIEQMISENTLHENSNDGCVLTFQGHHLLGDAGVFYRYFNYVSDLMKGIDQFDTENPQFPRLMNLYEDGVTVDDIKDSKVVPIEWKSVKEFDECYTLVVDKFHGTDAIPLNHLIKGSRLETFIRKYFVLWIFRKFMGTRKQDEIILEFPATEIDRLKQEYLAAIQSTRDPTAPNITFLSTFETLCGFVGSKLSSVIVKKQNQGRTKFFFVTNMRSRENSAFRLNDSGVLLLDNYVYGANVLNEFGDVEPYKLAEGFHDGIRELIRNPSEETKQRIKESLWIHKYILENNLRHKYFHSITLADGLDFLFPTDISFLGLESEKFSFGGDRKPLCWVPAARVFNSNNWMIYSRLEKGNVKMLARMENKAAKELRRKFPEMVKFEKNGILS